MCWPTGERETYDDTTHTMQAFASDGTLCFTQKPTLTSATYAFYDSSGNEILTYRLLDNGTGQVEVSCDGATYLSTPPFECSTVLGLRGKCASGFCPR